MRLTARNYVNRPINRNDARVARAIRFARFTADACAAPVSIELRNARNPNGITVSAEPGKPAVTERFICLAWARKNGYHTC